MKAEGRPESDSSARSVGPDGRPWSEQPKWRRDFPIDWPLDEFVARRDFTKFLVLTSLAFVVGQAWIVWENLRRRRRGEPPVRRVARLADVPVGSSLVFSYPREGSHAILVRVSEERVVAYDRACTHLLCPVIAQPERARLHCPCHNGNFDLMTGRPISGPPQRQLPRVTLEVRGGYVYATGVEETT